MKEEQWKTFSLFTHKKTQERVTNYFICLTGDFFTKSAIFSVCLNQNFFDNTSLNFTKLLLITALSLSTRRVNRFIRLILIKIFSAHFINMHDNLCKILHTLLHKELESYAVTKITQGYLPTYLTYDRTVMYAVATKKKGDRRQTIKRCASAIPKMERSQGRLSS